jgi:hypothetical protein
MMINDIIESQLFVVLPRAASISDGKALALVAS